MKNIKEFVNESRQIEYRVALTDALDSDKLPISVSIIVDGANQRAFEAWAKKEEGNVLSHCDGGNIEY